MWRAVNANMPSSRSGEWGFSGAGGELPDDVEFGLDALSRLRNVGGWRNGSNGEWCSWNASNCFHVSYYIE